MNASEARSEAKPSAVNAVAVIVDATSKWQADGRNTRLAHGRELDASALPLGVRFGIGGALALEFARGAAASARGLGRARCGRACGVFELDLVSPESVASAFAAIRREADEPEVVISCPSRARMAAREPSYARNWGRSCVSRGERRS
jgi:hypothetical protein